MRVASVGFSADVPMVSPPGQVQFEPVCFRGYFLIMEEMCQAGEKVVNQMVLQGIFFLVMGRPVMGDIKISLWIGWRSGEDVAVWQG